MLGLLALLVVQIQSPVLGIELPDAGDSSAEAWDQRAHVAAYERDHEGELIARLEALAQEDTPRRRVEAGRVVERFDRLVASMEIPLLEGADPEAALVFSADGTRVAFAGHGEVAVLDVEAKRVIARWSEVFREAEMPQHWAMQVELDPRGTRVAVNHGSEVVILDLKTAEVQRVPVPASAWAFSALAWKPSGNELALAAVEDRKRGELNWSETFVRCFDVGKREYRPGAWRVRGERRGLTWSPSGEHLALFLIDGVAVLSRDGAGYPVLEGLPPLDADPNPYMGHGYACAFHPSEPLLALFAGECHVALWHLHESRYVGPVFSAYSTGRDVLAFDPEGKRIAIGNRIGVRTFDTATGAPLAQPSILDGLEDDWREKYASTPTALSSDAAYYAEGGIEDSLRLYDARSCLPLRPEIRHGSQVVAVGFGPGGLVATAGRDRRVRVWRLEGEEPLDPPQLQKLTLEVLPGGRNVLIAEHRSEWVLCGREGIVSTFEMPGVVSPGIEFDLEGRRALLSANLTRGTYAVALSLVTGDLLGGPFVVGEGGSMPTLDGDAFDDEAGTVVVDGYVSTGRFDQESGRLLALSYAKYNYFEDDREDEDLETWFGSADQALGDGWGLRSSDGRTVEGVDTASGEPLFELADRRDVLTIAATPDGERLLAAFHRPIYYVVDLEALPRTHGSQRIRIPEDSAESLDGRTLEKSAVHARLRSHSPTRLEEPTPLRLDYDSDLLSTHVGVRLLREEALGARFVGMRPTGSEFHDVIAADHALRSDGTWIVGTREFKGGLELRFVDFAHPGEREVVGDPAKQLSRWNERLGRN